MNTPSASVGASFDDVPTNEAAVIHRHSRSFAFASCLLPADVRKDVRKLYAWCRWCDDAVDSATNQEDAKNQLQTLVQDVERIYRGGSIEHEDSKWLADLADRYSIKKIYPLTLLDAMSMDLRLGQIEDREELLEYCYGAAGVVGLTLCQIFKVSDPRAAHHASALGIAMQLTNIARDVLEDSQRGRCYLPKTWLRGDIESASNDDIRQTVQQILDLAEEHYRIADEGMEYLPGSVRPAIRVAAAVYREIGIEIIRRDHSVMRGRIVTPKSRFLMTALSASFSGLVHDTRRRIATSVRSFQPTISFDPISFQSESAMNDAKYVAWLGLSLTAFMGGALFLLVLLNPKDDSYSYLPLVYAVGCFLFGAVANFLARRNETPSPAPVNVSDERR